MTRTPIKASIVRDRRARTARADMQGDRRERRLQGRSVVGIAALAMAVLTGLALADPESPETQLYRGCSQVYNPEACRCAVASMPPSLAGSPRAAEQRVQVAERSPAAAASRVEAPRVLITRDFVWLVQACMSPGGDAPVD